MKLENQVCSLELAQKLKSLGVKQESLFQHNLLEKEDVYRITYGNPRTNTFGRKFIDTVSAFTVAELGEMLPESFWTVKRENKWWSFEGETIEEGEENSLSCADTEADARAKMLCYLLENKLI